MYAYATKMMSWRDSPAGMKILLVIAMSTWLVAMVSWFAMAGIETAALSQPRFAIGEYRHPHEVKCEIRYFTDVQDRVHAIAQPLWFGSLIILLVAGLAYNGVQKRLENEQKNASLQRYLAERDRH